MNTKHELFGDVWVLGMVVQAVHPECSQAEHRFGLPYLQINKHRLSLGLSAQHTQPLTWW